jgi:hypothetical protein
MAMSDDDDVEIIPPRRGLPAKRPENTPAQIGEVRRTTTGGAVNSMLTRWRADHESRALGSVAKRNRSEADVIKSYGEIADSFENTSRKVNRLRKLPEILAMDDAKFNAEQEGEYHAIDDERGERKHKGEVDKRRRQREIAEEEAKIVEAQRQKFTIEQGFENQQRLKDRNLRIFATRAETGHLNAEVKASKVRGELRGGEKPVEKPNSRDEIRARAEESLIQAFADGNDAEADRWQRVLDALDEG